MRTRKDCIGHFLRNDWDSYVAKNVKDVFLLLLFKDLASTESITTEVALSKLPAEQISQETVSTTTPQLQQAIQQQQQQFQLESTKTAEDLAQANPYAILKLQEVLQEAKYSPLPQPVQPVEVTQAPVQLSQYTQSTPLTQSLSQLIQSTSLATSQVLSPTVQATGTTKSQQDIIREQLQLLVNSGQIKIRKYFCGHLAINDSRVPWICSKK